MSPFDDEDTDFDLEDPTPEPPSVEVEPPEASDLDLAEDLESRIQDVDDDTLRAFVTCVFLANVALFAGSLGAMLLYFRGSWQWGGLAVVVGGVAGIRTYQHYREWDRNRDEVTDATHVADEPGSGTSDEIDDADSSSDRDEPADADDDPRHPQG